MPKISEILDSSIFCKQCVWDPRRKVRMPKALFYAYLRYAAMRFCETLP